MENTARYVAQLKWAQRNAPSIQFAMDLQNDVERICADYWDNEQFQIYLRDYMEVYK